MTTQDVANNLVTMWKAGEFIEAGEKYWADDAISIEPFAPNGGDTTMRGKEALRGKGEWWEGAHEVHGVEVEGPFVNGDRFVVRFKMDVTQKDNGQRFTMDETALYTIKDGKIAEEAYFYGGM
ncbi:MAG: nuclear transport factor 2 family protein [Proteobacteria bacterium]|nr:nuclear transport factor 2 family protein [Pseudomonadota bacterium]